MKKINQKTSILFLLLFTIQVALTSCATLFSGTKQQIVFNSTPPEADVVAIMKDGSELTIGKTPCTVEIKKKTRKINFIKDGYYTEQYNLRKNATIHWGLYADVASIFIFGTGFIPTLVDLFSQSFLVYPNQVKTELKKK